MAANIEEIAEKLDTLTLLEAAQLSKLLQEKWGVSAAAAVAVAAPAAGGGAAGGAAAEGEGRQGRSGGHEEEARGGRSHGGSQITSAIGVTQIGESRSASRSH